MTAATITARQSFAETTARATVTARKIAFSFCALGLDSERIDILGKGAKLPDKLPLLLPSRLFSVESFPERRNILLDFGESPLALFALLLFESLAFDLELHELAVHLIKLDWHAFDLHL